VCTRFTVSNLNWAVHSEYLYIALIVCFRSLGIWLDCCCLKLMYKSVIIVAYLCPEFYFPIGAHKFRVRRFIFGMV